MADAYLARLQATRKIRRLLAYAASIDNANEKQQALDRAKIMADEHGIDLVALQATPPPRNIAPPPETMAGMVGAISRAFPGIDNEDYSQYGKDRRGERKKPYYGDLPEERGDDDPQSY